MLHCKKCWCYKRHANGVINICVRSGNTLFIQLSFNLRFFKGFSPVCTCFLFLVWATWPGGRSCPRGVVHLYLCWFGVFFLSRCSTGGEETKRWAERSWRATFCVLKLLQSSMTARTAVRSHLNIQISVRLCQKSLRLAHFKNNNFYFGSYSRLFWTPPWLCVSRRETYRCSC